MENNLAESDYQELAIPEAQSPACRADLVFLNDDEWRAICSGIREISGRCAGEHYDTRVFVNAALSAMVGRCPWTRLPSDKFGDWRIAYNRNERWIQRGVWTALARDNAMPDTWSQQVLRYVDRRSLEKLFRARRSRCRNAPATDD